MTNASELKDDCKNDLATATVVAEHEVDNPPSLLQS